MLKPIKCSICPKRFSDLYKQPSGGVLRKRYSENMQETYRETLIPKCDFNKVSRTDMPKCDFYKGSLQLY